MNPKDDGGSATPTEVSAQTRAQLIQLHYATGPEMNDVAEALVVRGEALHLLTPILEKKIAEGQYILGSTLAALLARIRSFTLYAAVRKQLLDDPATLLVLYGTSFPDPEIQRRLCEQLFKSANDDSDPRRTQIVHEFSRHGSDDVLPVLESILYTHAPNLAARRAVVQAIETVGVDRSDALIMGLEFAARSNFLKAVAAAVAAIKARADTEHAPASQFATTSNNPIDDACDRAAHSLVLAKSYVSQDAIACLVCLRRGAEIICKEVCRLGGVSLHGKDLQKMMLADLLKAIATTDLPDLAKRCLKSIHEFGNFAGHDQGSEEQHLDEKLLSSVVIQYESALDSFRIWRAQR